MFVGALISSPKFVFPSTRPTWPLSLSQAISCQCLLHWTNQRGSQIKCCLQKLNVINPSWLLGRKKNPRPPSLLHPPGLHLPGCSPPPLLPLSSGSCRAGVPPISFPILSCCMCSVSPTKYSKFGPAANQTKNWKILVWPARELKVSRVTCQVKRSWRCWRHPASSCLPTRPSCPSDPTSEPTWI